MDRSRGSLIEVARNLVAPGFAVRRRVQVALRNGLRRLGPPPRACCDHPGEPGC